ncbi:unnamed protein product [Lupinus luteus]|uniref:Uncharacterized protein n=1 Tax=Lupinus luteus TaxID=3873 RepID=A0AAV1XLX9_LUPLU
MGIARFSLSVCLGAAIGIYVAQNYNAPNMREFVHSYTLKAKNIEEIYRKPQVEEENQKKTRND